MKPEEEAQFCGFCAVQGSGLSTRVLSQGLGLLVWGAVSQVTPAEEAQFRGFWAAHAGRPLQGRNKILASICPQLHGLFLVKLATALMLIGGVARREEAAGSRTRGELHMLLVGDPGTGELGLGGLWA